MQIFCSHFSFDVRGRPLNDAQHWSAPETFGSRARFNADVDPATLDIKVGVSCHSNTISESELIFLNSAIACSRDISMMNIFVAKKINFYGKNYDAMQIDASSESESQIHPLNDLPQLKLNRVLSTQLK